MKKLATLVFAFLLIGITSNATSNNSEVSGFNNYNPYDGSAYIFEEGGVEFSVFADGQFDFSYVGPYNNQQVQFNIGSPNVNISFNTGHNYELFVQYDDYGAVTQIENVPIYYDNYGRITQAGNVDIRYNNRRIVSVGGLFINYNYYGQYVSTTGFINTYNQFYIYRPWHAYYAAPIYSSCIVYDYPYRRYYRPIRYSYAQHSNYYNNRHRIAYQNSRRDFHRPGSRLHYKNGRTARNNNYNPNRRNTMISKSGRRGNTTTERPTTRNEKADRTRYSSGTKERNSANIGMVNRNRRGSIKTERPSTSNVNLNRSRPSSMNKEKQQASRPVASKRTASAANKNKTRTIKTSSRSNDSNTQDGNINSRATSSNRGRGL